ncbi:MAG: cyclic nucleotide-binding domain-containing protein [Acidimicrobiia bacterium]|nr:patatin-like phospholipase family protein [Acidimicrobiia bacterium]MBT8217179.1 patatin-like phospholipase family protein [Acidimicrobiia bacterium]NNF10098.1 cyclic nucleotide-binding domain-containing protein [Acidimicrobiia bacterium]NNL68612.1 cyclic nucleotide-binding domain-containing protein [Acidimicrobiia bacterium]
MLAREGDEAHCAWLLVSGRLNITTEHNGAARLLASLGPGSIVGEMALLTGAPRSATITSIRHSRLLRLGADAFERIVLRDADVLLQVARTVVRRLEASDHDRQLDVAPSTVAALPAGRYPEHHEFAARLAEVGGIDAHLVTSDSMEDAKSDFGALIDRLHQLEAQHDLLLLVADETDEAWTRWCVRHSDMALLVGAARGLGDRHEMEDFVVEGSSRRSAETHLVAVHANRVPSAASSFAPRPGVDRNHHVRQWAVEDLQRIGRIFTRTSIGLVLGGGGAKGFAHLGVIRALREAGIVIDHVGGSSIGAVVAGICAMDWSYEQMVEGAKRVAVDHGSLIDPGIPAIALAKGARLKRAIRGLYGDLRIEDLPLSFFCTSTDLTGGGVHVHHDGPLWEAVRASVAIPGIFPPMPTPDGRVLVDGSVLDSLPVGVMRHRHRPTILIASDITGTTKLAGGNLSRDGVMSGWRVAANRYLPRAEKLEVPLIADLLTSANAVVGHRSQTDADLLIAPPMDQFGILDFPAFAQILEAGYEHAARVLSVWDPQSLTERYAGSP